jgi:hypothetical protein
VRDEGGRVNIHDVLGYGPICASDEDVGALVTVNGSYVNLWVSDGRGGWSNTDCRSGHPDLYTLTAAQALDLAQDCLKDWLKENDE